MTHGWTLPGGDASRPRPAEPDAPATPPTQHPAAYPAAQHPPYAVSYAVHHPQGPPVGWYPSDPPPAPRRRTEPWAVVTLVAGAVALVPVAVVTGIVALVRMRRHDRSGLGFVVGGFGAALGWLVVGSVVTLVVVGGPGLGSLAASAPVDGRPSQIPASVGACVLRPADPGGTWVQTSCAGPNDGEVMWTGSVAGPVERWPGAGEAAWLVDDACYAAFEPYTGEAWEDSPLEYELFVPDRQGWERGRRTGVCLLVDPYADPAVGGAGRDV